MIHHHFIAAAFLTLFSLGIAASPAEAGSRYRAGPIIGYVTAHSHYGNGSVRGPVRDTRVGRQVRLPHGTWVYCRTSCSETLRVQTVDIFGDGQTFAGYGTLQNECGVFGCLTWERSF
jgi:hypothetical protein